MAVKGLHPLVRARAAESLRVFTNASDLMACFGVRPTHAFIDSNLILRKIWSDGEYGSKSFLSETDPVDSNIVTDLANNMISYMINLIGNNIPNVQWVFDGPGGVQLPDFKKRPPPQKVESGINNGVRTLTTPNGELEGMAELAHWVIPKPKLVEAVAKKIEALLPIVTSSGVWAVTSTVEVTEGEADHSIAVLTRSFPLSVVISEDGDYLVYTQALALIKPSR